MAVQLPGAERIFRVVRGLGFRQLGRDDIPTDRHAELKATIRENIAFGETITVDDIVEVERLGGVASARSRTLPRGRCSCLADHPGRPVPRRSGVPVRGRWRDDAGLSRLDDVVLCHHRHRMSGDLDPAGFTADGLPVGLQLVGAGL